MSIIVGSLTFPADQKSAHRAKDGAPLSGNRWQDGAGSPGAPITEEIKAN
jgi:hypothetical protein